MVTTSEVKWSESCSVVSSQLWPYGRPWNSLGQNTGVGSLSLLQGITRGRTLSLRHFSFLDFPPVMKLLCLFSILDSQTFGIRGVFWIHFTQPLQFTNRKMVFLMVAQMVKNLPAMRETWYQSLGWEDSLEKDMVTHSSILIWRIPWTEEPDRLQSMGPPGVRHNWVTNTLNTSFSCLIFWLEFLVLCWMEWSRWAPLSCFWS